MTISLELIESFSTIEDNIYKSLAVELNKKLPGRVRRGTSLLKRRIKDWMMESVEINSLLLHGIPSSLNAVFGLTASRQAVDAIVSAISNSFVIEFKPISRKLTGSVTFHFQPKDFAELLGLPEGHQFTEVGTDLHWLEWLLLKGDLVVVKGYVYEPSHKGRSGGGTMGIGGVFRVPPQFSGTVDDNFITRAFLGRDKELARILTSFLE